MSSNELSNEVLVEIIKKGWDPDGKYMMKLWNQNRTLVRKTVWNYTLYDNEEDLLQEAFIGFQKAVEEFDSEKEVSFITFALIWVKAAVSKYIRHNGSMIRLPSNIIDLLSRKRKFIKEYRNEFGEDPTDKEIASALDITIDRLMFLYEKESCCKNLKSINESFSEDDNCVLEDCLSDGAIPQEEIEEQIYRVQRAEAVWNEVDQLPDRQRQVIRMRYKSDLTLEECAAALGISSDAIRQHTIKGVKMLRTGKHRTMLIQYAEDPYSEALTGGINEFQRTRTSSTERVAIKNLERHRKALDRIATFIHRSEGRSSE